MRTPKRPQSDESATLELYRLRLREVELQLAPRDMAERWRQAMQPRIWAAYGPRDARLRLH